jgi:mannose-6-phosphate isomerase-like protein (cupin superfamily)
VVGKNYVRPFHEVSSLSEYPHFNARGYRNEMLSAFESAVLIASHIEEGGCGPELHYHKCDQAYYLLRGSTYVQLGKETVRADAGSLVFIPAGLAHGNHNDGPGLETHFEIIAPCPRPSVPIVYLVDSPDDVPADDRTDVAGFVRSHADGQLAEPLPGFRMTPLLGPPDGSRHITVNYAEVDPGKAGPATHVHAFDQYYLVLEGQLTIEIALHKQVAGPQTLIALPAGVPHRMYNASDAVEKHLVLIAPPPGPDSGPMDIGVLFEPNGISYG